MGLNKKQLIFVKEYLIDKNATRAAKAAGYSAKTARAMGSENLTKPDIADAIAKGLDAQVKTLESKAAARGITKERWLKELEMIAFANMDDFAQVRDQEIVSYEGEAEKKVTTIVQHVDLVTTMERKKGRSHAIKKLTETQTQHGGSLGIELHAKLPALELIGKAYGWVKDEVAITNNPPQIIITMPSNGREAKKE